MQEESKGIYAVMNKVIEYLGSAAFGTKLLIGSVIVQGFHSYYVFNDLSSYTGWAQIVSSGFYSTVLSSAILFFTMRRKYKVAYIFAFFEVSMNLYYFIMAMMLTGNYWGLTIAIPISLMLPYTIYSYSIAINEAIDEIKEGKGIASLASYAKNKMKTELLADVEKMIEPLKSNLGNIDIKYLQDTLKYFKNESEKNKV